MVQVTYAARLAPVIASSYGNNWQDEIGNAVKMRT